MKKKLTVLTLYTKEGASSNYRALIFKDKLEKEFEVNWFSFWNSKYSSIFLHNKKKYLFPILVAYLTGIISRLWQLYFVIPKSEILFIQKAVIPKIDKTFLKHLKRKNIRIIFDVDDAIFLLGKDNSHEIAGLADVVICGNNNLKEHYLQFNDNCVVLPTTDVTQKYKLFWKDTFEKKVIGWIGSKTTIDNLFQVVEPINKLIEKHPEVSFNIISNNALEFPNLIKNTKLIKWDSETYLKDLSELTIGIMPLNDNEMNRGKCGFKLIQYLNMKKPVIGSDVGVNGQIISQNGYKTKTEDDWYNALEKLLFNRKIYDSCLENIDKNFFSEYHYDVVAEKLVNYIYGKR